MSKNFGFHAEIISEKNKIYQMVNNSYGENVLVFFVRELSSTH